MLIKWVKIFVVKPSLFSNRAYDPMFCVLATESSKSRLSRLKTDQSPNLAMEAGMLDMFFYNNARQ
jgi:hypothetical protein